MSTKSAVMIPATVAAILVTAVFAGIVIKSSADPPQTQSIVLNVYKTASGKTCTSDDWQRQYLHGRKPGEEECRIASASTEAVPLDPRWQQQADCQALRVSLRNKRFGDMTPNDLASLDACKGVTR